MKVGITLPQFRDSPEPAIEAARLAESAGIDGVFVFDHLWPIGRPDRPCVACYPLLGALAVETVSISIGSLVARVSLLPNAVLAHKFETLHRLTGTRLIAGLGAGDDLSKPENEAYGLPYPSADERRRDLAECCRMVGAVGVTTWVGGLSSETQRVGRECADAINVWGVEPEVVRTLARDGQVTWGGPVPDDATGIAGHLRELARAGASWAICAPVYRDGSDAAKIAAVAEAAANWPK